MPKPKWKFVGISFEHMHMGDLLRMVSEHPEAEIAGVCDPQAREHPDIRALCERLGIPEDRVFTEVTACMETARPDVALLCPATARHADFVEKVAPFGTHILVEKPFASCLAEADRMIAALQQTGRELFINWPLRWYPCHVTAKALCDEGAIGEVQQVHYFDGNRGPLCHGADKLEKEPGEKSKLWWYQRSAGGGSLLDYLGYGVTLGTWFLNGKLPIDITTVVDQPTGLEVDEHSITIARYPTGLSKFETRWGTFTDPWKHQPQPKCGFVLVGEKGTISSYDYESTIRLQTEACPEGKDIPVQELTATARTPIAYVIDCLSNNRPPEGPLSPEVSRIGQRIVDTACLSAERKQTIPLLD